jgi:hypothetical protein
LLDATFDTPDLTTFCRLDGLGLIVVGQRLEPGRAVLACTVVPTEDDRWCRRCGGEGSPRGDVSRELAHEPFGWRPTTLPSFALNRNLTEPMTFHARSITLTIVFSHSRSLPMMEYAALDAGRRRPRGNRERNCLPFQAIDGRC